MYSPLVALTMACFSYSVKTATGKCIWSKVDIVDVKNEALTIFVSSVQEATLFTISSTNFKRVNKTALLIKFTSSFFGLY